MKIIKFTAENVKKLRAVEITPSESLVEITGKNGEGKSSVLDAIWYAFQGGSVIPSRVVRQGEERAFVKLDLGELVVTRRFSANGNTSLVVEAADGAKYPSPQRMLDELVGALSFDPLEFTRMDSRAQLEALRRVVTFDIDIDKIDLETRKLVEARTSQNRELRSLEAQEVAAPNPIIHPQEAEPVNVAALMDEITTCHEHNKTLDQERKRREAVQREIEDDRLQGERCRFKAEEMAVEIDRLKKLSDSLLESAEGYESKADGQEQLLRQLESVEPNRESGALVQRVRKAETINRKIEQRVKYLSLTAQVTDKRQQVSELTRLIDANVVDRAEALARALMPVEGLALGEGEVIYQGFPLINASSAEQLRVSVGIAMSANPKLKVLRVKDGSLLDESSLALLASLAVDRGYQVWLERVDETGGRPCVVMEDGAVKFDEKTLKLAEVYGIPAAVIQDVLQTPAIEGEYEER